MKYYLVDEISDKDMDKIRGFLKQNAVESQIEGLFWIELSEDLLNKQQSLHKGCQPYRFALEMGKDWIKAELFIRSSDNIRCDCSGYCNASQRDFISNFIESMISKLSIKT